MKLKLFKVVAAGTKKAVESMTFTDKESAKNFRNDLNKEAGYKSEDDVSGRAMPFRVSKEEDHWASQ